MWYMKYDNEQIKCKLSKHTSGIVEENTSLYRRIALPVCSLTKTILRNSMTFNDIQISSHVTKIPHLYTFVPFPPWYCTLLSAHSCTSIFHFFLFVCLFVCLLARLLAGICLSARVWLNPFNSRSPQTLKKQPKHLLRRYVVDGIWRIFDVPCFFGIYPSILSLAPNQILLHLHCITCVWHTVKTSNKMKHGISAETAT